jgi:hypothetical protein
MSLGRIVFLTARKISDGLGFLKPYAGLIAVDEHDAGLFQRTLNGIDGTRLKRFAGFETRNRARRNFGQLRDIANPKLERGSGHSGLGRRHRNSAPI